MMHWIVDHLVLIGVFVGGIWFLLKHIVADLPDDILSQLLKRAKSKKEGGDNGGVRDHR
jgi:hypothetical protein